MNIDALLDFARAIVLLFILIVSVHFLYTRKHSIRMTLFSLAIACILFSDIYWLTFDSLYPDIRMPFAANEIGEWAMFLLMGAALTAYNPIEFMKAKLAIICTCLFVAGNTALWIAWTGEWLQDILTGITLCYFICAVVYRMKQEEAFSAIQWILLGITCPVLLIGQAGIFFVDSKYKNLLDMSCYVLLFVVAAIFIARSIYSLVQSKNPKQAICHSFSSFAWIVITLYMSGATFYYAAMILSMIGFILMLLALKKEETAV